MPTASLLLPLLARLRRLIPSVLALLPVLLRPPPLAARLSPFALPRPPFVQRLALFASRPLASLATPPNHARPPHRPAVHRPAACPLALWQSTRVRRQARQACVRLIPLLGESNRVGASRVGARGLRLNPSPEGEGRVRGLPVPVYPRQSNGVGASRIGVRVFRSKRHPAAPSPRAVPTPPQTPPKSAPRRPKSFLETRLSPCHTYAESANLYDRPPPALFTFSCARRQSESPAVTCGESRRP